MTSSFWFFEAKEAVEVIEASIDIMYFEVIEATAQHSKGGTKVVFWKCVFDIYQLQFDLE